MFDVGFFELMLIGMIALLVIGPTRLPKVARTVGAYLGKAQRMLATVKSQVDQELAVSELKESLAAQAHAIESGTTDIIRETRNETEFLNTTAPGARGPFNNSLTEAMAAEHPNRPNAADRQSDQSADQDPSPHPSSPPQTSHDHPSG